MTPAFFVESERREVQGDDQRDARAAILTRASGGSSRCVGRQR